MNLKQHVTKQHVITVYNMPKHYRCDRVTYVLLAYRYIMSRYAVKSSTNFPKLSDYNTHHQVEHSKILHCAHNAFMCFVRYHNQTATFALHNLRGVVLYNRGRTCLQCGTQ